MSVSTTESNLSRAERIDQENRHNKTLHALESGFAHELMIDECYLPAHKSRQWIRCFITLSGKDFRLYLENRRRFLLSAVQVDNDNFLISMNEDFPLRKDPATGEYPGYSASVCRLKDKTFIVSLNYCHLCDQKLGRMDCGRGPNNREVIAKVTHSIRRFKVTNADMRCIFASFPYLGSVPRHISERNIWCPRAIRKVAPALPMDADIMKGVEVHPNKVTCVNKLPEWNPDLGSLVLKFQGNRVLSSSSKNFLLYEERKLKNPPPASTNLRRGRSHTGSNASLSESRGEDESTAMDSEVSVDFSHLSQATDDSSSRIFDQDTSIGISADHALLQFGKATENRFILDFKYPLSPLQAFGIAICSFAPDEIKSTPRGHEPSLMGHVRMNRERSDSLDSISTISSINSATSSNNGSYTNSLGPNLGNMTPQNAIDGHQERARSHSHSYSSRTNPQMKSTRAPNGRRPSENARQILNEDDL